MRSAIKQFATLRPQHSSHGVWSLKTEFHSVHQPMTMNVINLCPQNKILNVKINLHKYFKQKVHFVESCFFADILLFIMEKDHTQSWGVGWPGFGVPVSGTIGWVSPKYFGNLMSTDKWKNNNISATLKQNFWCSKHFLNVWVLLLLGGPSHVR